MLSVSTSNLSAGDFDGDGYQELVTVGAGGIDILPGTRRGPAEKRGSRLVVMSPIQTAVSDLNGDKLPDIAVTSSNQMGNAHTNSLFSGPERSFAVQVGVSKPLYAPRQPRQCISAGDLNGRWLPELVISNFGLYGLYANQRFSIG